MIKTMKAYYHEGRDITVTQKSMIPEAKSYEFREVTLAVSMEDIMEWAEETEVMGLDEE